MSESTSSPETDTPGDGPFEIGFVMAGAVSAGAYTAGVMDFLFEALDGWAGSVGTQDTGLGQGRQIAALDVTVKALSGASAGGVSAAIAAAAAQLDFKPVREGTPDAQAARNPFWRTWVDGLDISPLLATDDLTPGEPLISLLNTRVMERIATGVIAFSDDYKVPRLTGEARRKRAWLADPFHVDLSVTNLQGVPYGIGFGTARDPLHRMYLHKDYVSFLATPGETPCPDAPAQVCLSPVLSGGDEGWQQLAQASLATGAFPLAFRAREITRPDTDYAVRFGGGSQGVYAWPDKPGGASGEPYSFYTVDGGAMNNEPYDIAHERLSRAGDKADDRFAIVMIDPFTDAREAPPERTDALGKVMVQLLYALMSQSRFRVSELEKAAASDNSTYFMIAPKRGSLRGDQALVGTGLGGFIGFFDRAFRRHDYLLGRHNCRSFLHNFFVLPSDHWLIERRRKQAAGFWDAYRIHDPFNRSVDPDTGEAKAPGQGVFYPVIPLVNGLDADEARPPWPAVHAYWQAQPALRQSVSRRIAKVTEVIARGEATGTGVSRTLMQMVRAVGARLAGRLIAARATATVMGLVEDAVLNIIHRRQAAERPRSTRRARITGDPPSPLSPAPQAPVRKTVASKPKAGKGAHRRSRSAKRPGRNTSTEVQS